MLTHLRRQGLCIAFAVAALNVLGVASLRSAEAGALTLAPPFTDHMVLQCDMPLPIWGTAAAGETVTVEFAGQLLQTSADVTGAWSTTLAPTAISAVPRMLTVRGRTTLVCHDVLVGEVWLCAGQSNMQASLGRLRTATYPNEASKQDALAVIERELTTRIAGIRLFQINAGKPGTWGDCAPELLGPQDKGGQGFSAVGYFFGKRLQAELQVPIGLIQAAVGGSRIELWTPPEAYAASPRFQAEAAKQPLVIDGVEPGKFYRSMIRPWARFPVRGVLWYQGESNVIAGDVGPRYADKLQTLIDGWRTAWSQSNMPFYFVQLPPMAYSRRKNPSPHTPLSLPYVREGQAMALRVPDTGMIAITDLAPTNDIHPADKWNVGLRLANLALVRTYGKSGLVVSGPVFRAMEPRGSTLVVHFDSTDGGLQSRDNQPLTGFAVAGADRIFVAAQATIEGDHVVVSSDRVSHPVAVRFAWHEDARPNLCNAAGLPALQFRTDDWPIPRSAHATSPSPAEQK